MLVKSYRSGDLSKDGQSLTPIGNSKPEQIIGNILPDLGHEPIKLTSGSQKKQIALYTGRFKICHFKNIFIVKKNLLSKFGTHYTGSISVGELTGNESVEPEKTRPIEGTFVKFYLALTIIIITSVIFIYKLPWWYYIQNPTDAFDELIETMYKWKRKRRNSKSIDSEVESEISLPKSASNSNIDLGSKYTREYETVRILGKGGFGLVFESLRKGDKQQLAVKRIKVKNKNHKDKIWREAALHQVLQNHDVEFTHLIQYYDAWEEDCDRGDIKQHDSTFVTKFNREHQEQDTELITTIDESETTESIMSKKSLSRPQLKRDVSFAIHTNNSAGCTDSWDGSETWTSSDDDDERLNSMKSEVHDSIYCTNSISIMTSP